MSTDWRVLALLHQINAKLDVLLASSVDPEKVADLTAQLATSEAELKAAVEAATPKAPK